MTVFLTRSDWTEHGPVRPLEPLVPSAVRGFVVHWPGTTAPIGNASASSIAARLEGYRRMHTAPGGLGVPQGGNDIAYNYAIDQAARVWPLRGIVARPGANGSETTNGEYGALLLMLGPGERPGGAMVQAVRDWRHHVWLRYYPHADVILGHRDVYGTDCPGDLAYHYVKDGEFAGPPARFTLRRILRTGVHGDDVRALQHRIGCPADGIFGSITAEHVVMWQRGHHIAADGIVGQVTAHSLGWIWAG